MVVYHTRRLPENGVPLNLQSGDLLFDYKSNQLYVWCDQLLPIKTPSAYTIKDLDTNVEYSIGGPTPSLLQKQEASSQTPKDVLEPCRIINDTTYVSVCDDGIVKAVGHKGFIFSNTPYDPSLAPSTTVSATLINTEKHAFRTGSGDSSTWNPANMGDYSSAFGVNTVASGPRSHSEGLNSIASGDQSHAEGQTTTSSGWTSHSEGFLSSASANQAHAEGHSTSAAGHRSHAEGYNTQASGNESHAEGNESQATGHRSHAEGYSTQANGTNSHAEGYSTQASGSESHAEGNKTQASGGRSHAEGFNSTALGNESHAEGYDTSASKHQSHAEGYQTIASGTASHTEGSLTITFGNSSHAEGSVTLASATASHAEGYATEASGTGAHSEGASTYATATGAHAEGYRNISSGLASHVGGVESTSNYYSTFVHGDYLHSNSVRGVSLWGQNGYARSGLDHSIQLAGGGGDITSPGAGSDGIGLILQTTAMGANPQAKGIANAWEATGADYAEYFEWEDGNPESEDRVGYFIALKEDKIKIANEHKDVVGVISGTTGLVGDSASLHWHDANIKDEFGRIEKNLNYSVPIYHLLDQYQVVITEDIQEILEDKYNPLVRDNIISQVSNFIINGPLSQHIEELESRMLNSVDESKDSKAQRLIERIIQLKEENAKFIHEQRIQLAEDIKLIAPRYVTRSNPCYNSQLQYIPRSERKEWSPVGLIGKLFVRDNGKCKPGQKCICGDGGIAVPSESKKGYPVLARSSPNVIRILFK